MKILVVVILVITVVRAFLKKKKKNRRGYSLGLKSAEKVQGLVKNKNYTEAEKIVKSQSLNDITQIVDHLALSLDEKVLSDWNTVVNNDLSKLVLGVYYLHLAWIHRGHSFASEVSEEEIDVFFDYLEKCKDNFELIPEESLYTPEVTSRNIRLYMSLQNKDLISENFYKVSKKHTDFVWPFIHYAEYIQPKWSNDISLLEEFYDELPNLTNDFLTYSIVELKLILDSLSIKDNYFKKHTNDINDFALNKIIEIDEKLGEIEINSVHKYILYNCMESIADIVKHKKLRNKYDKLSNFNLTIYPYGVALG